MPKLKIAVLYGGVSAEDEVSLQSGTTVCSWLDKNKYEIYPVFINKKGAWFLQEACMEHENQRQIFPVVGREEYNIFTEHGYKMNIDLFFPILHGQYGEDGSIQGLFEQMHAAYAGCDVTSSAVGMDKQISKMLAKKAGIPVLDDILLDNIDELDESLAAKLGYPLFVKPVRQGSSVGVSRVNNAGQLKAAAEKAFKFDTRIMIEKAVDKAREIVCGIIGGADSCEVSVCGEVIPKKFTFFDYEAKYHTDDGVDFVTPAKIKPETSALIQKYAKDFFKLFNGSGFARIDFLMNQDESQVYFCEINTIPGYTSHSLFPGLWRATGYENYKVLDVIVEAALLRHKAKSAVLTNRNA